ncbi:MULTISPECIES: long-chain fatty acid--CoA ligase [Brevibacterium]|nr:MULTISPECIES: long-chain fatty acid--CoA ligase [Brevibacterium]
MPQHMLKGIASTQGDSYPLNTTTFLKRAARLFPHQEIVYRTADGGWARTDYGAYGKRVSRLANALGELGIGAGTMVGVLDWNNLRHFELYFGVPAVGATFLQLNLRLAPDDVEYVADHSQAKWIFVDESLLPVAEALAPKIYAQGWVVMSDRPASEIETSLPNVHFYEDLLAQASDEYDYPLIEETTAAYAGYTTGTTGRPKGIYYSHRSIYLHTLSIMAALKASYDEVVMPVTPMFHVLSWGFPQMALAAGAKLVLPGRFSAEDIGQVADALAAEHVTIANGAPSLFAPMLEHFRAQDEAPDLSSTRLISGSTEPPLSLMRGFRDATGADVIHAYGASETTPLVTTNWKLKPDMAGLSEAEQWDLKRSQGLYVPGIEVKVVDPEGNELPWDGKSMGEVLLRGPWITESYFKLDDSADRFLDGWWRSGDVGMFYENGYLKLTDRLKDVIKSGGEWISSIDMENAILDNPKVLEAAVIGVPDEKFQERPVAYVVTRKGEELTQEQVNEGLLGRFAKWQLPDQVIFTDELPRTSVGKLDKKLLRKDWEK